jgi:PTH1 family peptidyl-tRNA hydrolase
MKIIVGLGNPGEQYEKTRHNAGFMALDVILGDVKWKMDKKFNAFIFEKGGDIFVKPQTFMNNSGISVRAILDYHHLLPRKMGIVRKKDIDLSDTLIVIHDDLDIDFGKYKISIGSRSAGNNGVESIINHLKTKNFKRIRMGIKTERREHVPAEKFVLERFNQQEMETVKELSESVAKEL